MGPSSSDSAQRIANEITLHRRSGLVHVRSLSAASPVLFRELSSRAGPAAQNGRGRAQGVSAGVLAEKVITGEMWTSAGILTRRATNHCAGLDKDPRTAAEE